MLLGKYRITPQKNTNLGVTQSFKMWPQKETVLRQIGQPSFSDFHCVKDVDIKALSIGVENSINLMLFSTPLDSAWFVFSSDTSMAKNLVYCPKLFKWDQNLRCTPLSKRWGIPSYSHGSVQGRIQDFLEGGALVSCSTSTPINHIVFFLQNTSCIRKPHVISGGRGVCTPCTLPLDPPLHGSVPPGTNSFLLALPMPHRKNDKCYPVSKASLMKPLRLSKVRI